MRRSAASSLLLLGVAGVGRILRPTGFVMLLPAEKQSGPHAIPPTIAVLGLIVMLTITPQPTARLRFFVLSAALILLVRIYLVHRADLRLIADVERSRERLRLLAKDTARLKSLILGELLQTFCEAARDVLGVRFAAIGLARDDSGYSHFACVSGEMAGWQASGPQPSGEVLRPDYPVPITGPTRQPESAGLRPGRPLAEGFLAMPVAVGDSGHGALYLAGKLGGGSARKIRLWPNCSPPVAGRPSSTRNCTRSPRASRSSWPRRTSACGNWTG